MFGRLSLRKAVQRLSGSGAAAKVLLSTIGFGKDNTIQGRDLLSDYSLRPTAGLTLSLGSAIQPTDQTGLLSAVSPDGNWLAICYNGNVSYSPTPKPYLQMYKRAGKAWSYYGALPDNADGNFVFAAMKFSPNATRFRALIGNAVYTWTLSGGSWLRSTPILYPFGQTFFFDESDDGRTLLIFGRDFDDDGNPTGVYSKRYFDGVLQGSTSGASVTRASGNVKIWCSPTGVYNVTFYLDTGSNGQYWESPLAFYKLSSGYIGRYQYSGLNNVRANYARPCWIGEDKFITCSVPTTSADKGELFVHLHLFNAATAQPVIATPIKLCAWSPAIGGVNDIVPLGNNLYGIVLDEGSIFVASCDGASITLVGPGAKAFPEMKAASFLRQ